MYRIYLFLLSLLALASCAKAPSESDRWRGRGSEPETTTTHQLLLEKYTGQECVNCPTAASLLEGLQASHPDRLIVVSMHAAYTGQTLPELRSPVADSYAKAFHIQRAIPGIMLDRRPFSSGEMYSTSSARWTSEILSALKTPASLTLSLALQSADEGKAWSCRVEAKSASSASLRSGDYQLTLWLVEDVIAPQQTASGKNPSFLHHNVLRSELAKVPLELGKPFTETFAIPAELKDKTKAKIIAFVSDTKTDRILEARLQPVPEASSSQPKQPKDPSEDQPGGEVKEPTFVDATTSKPIPSGSLIACQPERPLELLDGIAEVASPYVRLLLPKGQQGPFDIEVQTTSSGAGPDTHGLRGICLESCRTLETLSTSFSHKGYKPQPTDLIGIHYGLKKAFTRREGTYEVKLYLKQSGKTLASLTYRFTITAKDFAKEADPPVEPKPPTPDPKPDPTPDPTPPGGNDDIPEALKTHVVAFDFTGQYCGYCAAALNSVARAKRSLGEHFLPVAIQSRGYNKGSDLLSEDFEMYRGFYKPTGYPNIFIGNNKEKVYHAYLEDRARALIAQKPQAKIRFSATNTATEVSVHFKALPNNGMTSPSEVRVLFLLVQSNMIAYQINVSDTYSHQHVLRRGLNNRQNRLDSSQWVWGSTYSYGADFSATFKLEQARYPGSMAIVPKDCEVIAILLDASTKEFVNAASVQLK